MSGLSLSHCGAFFCGWEKDIIFHGIMIAIWLFNNNKRKEKKMCIGLIAAIAQHHRNKNDSNPSGCINIEYACHNLSHDCVMDKIWLFFHYNLFIHPFFFSFFLSRSRKITVILFGFLSFSIFPLRTVICMCIAHPCQHSQPNASIQNCWMGKKNESLHEIRSPQQYFAIHKCPCNNNKLKTKCCIEMYVNWYWAWNMDMIDIAIYIMWWW